MASAPAVNKAATVAATVRALVIRRFIPDSRLNKTNQV
jgi:hypothetical protein